MLAYVSCYFWFSAWETHKYYDFPQESTFPSQNFTPEEEIKASRSVLPKCQTQEYPFSTHHLLLILQGEVTNREPYLPVDKVLSLFPGHLESDPMVPLKSFHCWAGKIVRWETLALYIARGAMILVQIPLPTCGSLDTARSHSWAQSQEQPLSIVNYGPQRRTKKQNKKILSCEIRVEPEKTVI